MKRHTGQTLKGMLGPAVSGTPAHRTCWPRRGSSTTPTGCTTTSRCPSSEIRQAGVRALLRRAERRHRLPEPLRRRLLHRICNAQFDQLYKEGAESGRVMCIALHPYLIGQPHRIKYLEETLRYILSHDGVWQPPPMKSPSITWPTTMTKRWLTPLNLTYKRGLHQASTEGETLCRRNVD